MDVAVAIDPAAADELAPAVVTALRARRIEAGCVSPDDPELASARLVLNRSRRGLDRVLALPAGVQRINAPEVLRQGGDVRAFTALKKRGVPLVECEALAAGRRFDLLRWMHRREIDAAVVRPATGESERVHVAEGAGCQRALDAMLATGDVLLSTFLPAVCTAGELSIVYVAGCPALAVRSIPSPGDFRARRRFGATAARVDPPTAALLLGHHALCRFAPRAELARADFLQDAAGDWRLRALDVVAPDLEIALAPELPDRIAGAIAGRLPAARAAASS